MSLMDELRKISEQVNVQRHLITTEEAAKHVFVLPFIQALGYNVFDIIEVVPEYTADFGTKQGEKVDYAIMREGKPIILIEAKSANVSLSAGHAAQLFRYYATTEARFGILTNGVKYQFYADLDKRNQMDRQPFLTIDMLNLDERLMKELDGFTKAGFDPERILLSAKKLKYKPEIRLQLENEYQQPSRELVKCLTKQLYAGTFKQSVFEEFAPIVKEAFSEFIDDRVASRLQGREESEPAPVETKAEIAVEASPIKSVEDSVEIAVFADFEGRRFERTLALTSKSKNVLGHSARIIKRRGTKNADSVGCWKGSETFRSS